MNADDIVYLLVGHRRPKCELIMTYCQQNTAKRIALTKFRVTLK